MATRGERQALLFLTAVALLGAGTRLYRSRRVSGDVSGVEAQLGAMDQARKGRPAKQRRAPARVTPPADSPAGPVDVDRAAASDIEKLPGIGPALARRIVADRDANGPFGCLQSLDAVKGIGPALLRRIDSVAVFSGPPRPGCATVPSGRPE